MNVLSSSLLPAISAPSPSTRPWASHSHQLCILPFPDHSPRSLSWLCHSSQALSLSMSSLTIMILTLLFTILSQAPKHILGIQQIFVEQTNNISTAIPDFKKAWSQMDVAKYRQPGLNSSHCQRSSWCGLSKYHVGASEINGRVFISPLFSLSLLNMVQQLFTLTMAQPVLAFH